MPKLKPNPDYSKITLPEALEWVETNCKFYDVIKRLRSRAVAYKLYVALQRALEENTELKNKIAVLENGLEK
jgi:hypothetical protein